jgi:hypothetical protein
MSMEENELNEFESAVPGQSLVSGEMGSVPWETPADFPEPDDFYLYTQDKLMNDDENLSNVVKLFEMDVTADAIVDGLIMNAFMMGQISADTGVVLKEPILELLLLIAKEAEVVAPRRDEMGDRQKAISVEEALANIDEGNIGEEEQPEQMEEDMLVMGDEPTGMMAPPEGMDAMLPMEAEEEVPMGEEEEEQTTLMMG